MALITVALAGKPLRVFVDDTLLAIVKRPREFVEDEVMMSAPRMLGRQFSRRTIRAAVKKAMP